MAFKPIPGNPSWEYDDNPPDPGGNNTVLWSTGTNGIRTSTSGQEIYQNTRLVGSNAPSKPSEISKTFWDRFRPKLLLDLYPGAAAAYSLRSLTGNGGNVVNVRRSSDDAERDFTAQEVSDGTLVDFVGEDVTIYQSDFSSGADSWIGRGVTADGNQDGVSDGTTSKDNVLKLTKDRDEQSWILRNQGVVAGLTYTVSGSFYVPSTNTAVDSILIKDGTVGSKLSTFPSGYLISSGTWTDFSFSYTANVSGNQRINMGVSAEGNTTNATVAGSTGDVAYIADLKFVATTAEGFVETWYDQSGNGRHATQSTAASQPKIVDGGALVTENNTPTVDFTGEKFLSLTSNTSFVSVFSIQRATAAFQGLLGSGNTYIHTSSNASGRVYTFNSFANTREIYANGAAYANESVPSLGYHLLNTTFDGSESFGQIGANPDYNAFNPSFPKIGVMIYYNSDQSANRDAIEANLAAQYGITLA